MGRVRKMPYIRLYAAYYHDAKVLSLGPEAELVWLRSIGFSKNNDLDGFVPEYALPALMAKCHQPPSAIADEIVTSKLWLPTDGGFQHPITTWTGYQVTAEEAEHRRAEGRERQARWRAKHAQTRNGDDHDPS